ncbi:glycoside hydrolase domain-containing protein [Flavihumibacter profundi]|uniref:glycoside hydrolase domain-containing protein n=1 Tax=Flavihumibacter profundi TaxID=2716883 RepID=UPI001CC784C8|nr:glycoside hydrolase domain-containing protein [Flavihumibacter profundi]MBZ5858929.1 DUF6067 family protein [Flavihumibacter profundi]
MKKLLLLASFIMALMCLNAQDPKYTDGKHSWNEDSLGNHRAVITFSGKGQVARVIISWRRPDENPDLKRIIVQDARTSQKILNTYSRLITNEKGDIQFEPVSGPGTYYIYFMPYKNEGRANYPKGSYLPPENTSSKSWLASLKQNQPVNAFAHEIQAIDAFNSFYPMEVCATAAETQALVAKSGRKDFIVFTEARDNPIRMPSTLPYHWIKKGTKANFSGIASRGEKYSFQIGLYTLQKVDSIQLSFSALTDQNGNSIPAGNLSCINTRGIDYKGQAFEKTLSVPASQVQALWCLANIPAETRPGTYTGKVLIHSAKTKPYTLTVTIKVNDKILADGGISEPWKQTRLHWLNSTLFQDNTVIDPYIPIKVENNTLSFLGRKVELNEDGFPKQIQTFFSPEMTGYTSTPNNLLASPIRFEFSGIDSGSIKYGPPVFTKKQEGTVEWSATSNIGNIQMKVNGSLEFDGFMTYTVKITALSDTKVNDISMQIPLEKDAAKYMMGLGQTGGTRAQNFNWKWNVAYKNQDGAWLGNVNAGLQYSLRDENYSRPLNTNFYLQKPLNLPTSWGNENKGGIRITENGNSVLVNNYSGDRLVKEGESLYYNFTLLITPFHPINTDFQWENRFYHRAHPIETIKASGATVVNIHHGTRINPWINYPFIEYRQMKAFIDSAHQAGLKVKIYNTVRELSDKAYETFPMRSLGHEIYSPGKGGGFSWLQEHIGKDYIAAWFVPEVKDAAIVNSGMSRWHNYYVEGMNWLVQNVGIDGIYLDDVAFDRITMKRIKRALTKDGHPGIIDLHSANQFNKNDGFNNSANLYLEHFPYLNRLWFGEYFDYEKNKPDFYLTEVSGIPFGLMGEMLEGGGNPWRGMVYGMTNRYPWDEKADPRNIWKAWDSFGMKGTSMVGYWSPNCPVTTSVPGVLATVYQKQGAAMISVASWADENTNFKLLIDWKKLGINPEKATISAPAIKNFQEAKTFHQDDLIPVEKNKGWLIIIKEG